MIFNSFEFLVFFPFVAFLYFLLPHKFRWAFLLLASSVFYMAFIPVYIFLFLTMVVFDYAAGIWIEKKRLTSGRSVYIVAIGVHLGILFLFKYFNFFSETINSLLLHGFGIKTYSLPYLHLVLPLALSFHTLRAISYFIEIYRGKMPAEKHFGIFASYAVFFPRLINGPIEKPYHLLPQFREIHVFDSENLLGGLRLMLWGFFKKVVIADRLALYVNTVYDQPGHYHSLNLILAVVFFSFQIYCDFSGYSDIALGSARIMGFRLSRNFDLPFASKSMSEFWRKWHITLSVWYNDYLFKPIFARMARFRNKAVIVALFVTFLLSGMWHGARWTFVIYGSIHGLVLIYEYLTRHYRMKLVSRIPKLFMAPILVVSMFLFNSFCWIFFRASSLSQALQVIRNSLVFSGPFSVSSLRITDFGYTPLLISLIGIAVVLKVEKHIETNMGEKWTSPAKDVLFCAAVLSGIILFGVYNNNNFIYSKF
jgi:alginate O-acetyltransferase complex protein AlgI